MGKLCIGGPLNGSIFKLPTAGPKGFLLVNRLVGEVVIYDFVPGISAYEARPTEPEIADRSAPKNRYRAALENNYAVIAYDPEVMPPWAQ